MSSENHVLDSVALPVQFWQVHDAQWTYAASLRSLLIARKHNFIVKTVKEYVFPT
ncbi:hypothetical protein [Pelagibius sp. Alg239-R121]|uniref:hypothetical protein n=1 Tax=Pelagibius sp. Alg239-R121 TaxID=2993448 RepID=UPI0024A773CF|nr:hypothetical protein [Pelagibius sp. Alg239-R121]